MTFGNGVALGDASARCFTAGPNNEEDGLFGRLNMRSLMGGGDEKPSVVSAETDPRSP